MKYCFNIGVLLQIDIFNDKLKLGYKEANSLSNNIYALCYDVFDLLFLLKEKLQDKELNFLEDKNINFKLDNNIINFLNKFFDMIWNKVSRYNSLFNKDDTKKYEKLPFRITFAQERAIWLTFIFINEFYKFVNDEYFYDYYEDIINSKKDYLLFLDIDVNEIRKEKDLFFKEEIIVQND